MKEFATRQAKKAETKPSLAEEGAERTTKPAKRSGGKLQKGTARAKKSRLKVEEKPEVKEEEEDKDTSALDEDESCEESGSDGEDFDFDSMFGTKSEKSETVPSLTGDKKGTKGKKTGAAQKDPSTRTSKNFGKKKQQNQFGKAIRSGRKR